MTTEPEEGPGASVAPVTIFHKCAYNPKGVSRETCRNTTCVLIRNLQGCVVTNCDSPERLCKQCLVEAGNSEKVVDSVSGLCAKHLEVAGKGEVYKQTKLERWQTTPDYTPPSMLEARFRKEGVQESAVVTKRPKASSQALPTGEEVGERLKKLPDGQYELALNIVHGDSVEKMADVQGVSVKAISQARNRLYRTLMFSKNLSSRVRMELLWKGFEALGIVLPPLPPVEVEHFDINIEAVPIEHALAAVPKLEPKARAVLKLLARYDTNREIAVKIDRTPGYVSTQISIITETLGLRQYKDARVRRALAARVGKVLMTKTD